MKRFLVILPLFFCFLVKAQVCNSLTDSLLNIDKAVKLQVHVTEKEQLKYLVRNFSVERGDIIQTDSIYTLQIWLSQKDTAKFYALKLPYSISETIEEAKALTMATTIDQMANWDRYPTYDLYLQMMAKFQNEFPAYCSIDTILANTPRNHAIIAAKIGNLNEETNHKPVVFYSAAMHGDEIAGYVILLRLIDYLLNNPTNPQVRNILDNVIVYLCPLENPDGTFYQTNTSLSSARRVNALGHDLNRSYPSIGIPARSAQILDPEVDAMINFIKQKKVTLALNLHGGAELYNYPWDRFPSSIISHPDDTWWIRIGHRFADTCHAYSPPTYFRDQTGVTNGGDWYVVDGSRLDYLNYYLGCRDATVEISKSFLLSTDRLPIYWGYLKPSLINYIEEVLYGFSGMVTDSVTRLPLEAMVFVENHDNTQSMVFSTLPAGTYHRPINPGQYTITFFAENYTPKSMEITVLDKQLTNLDVQLSSIVSVNDLEKDLNISINPNPFSNQINIKVDETALPLNLSIYDLSGRLILNRQIKEVSITLNSSEWTQGVYFIKIGSEKGNTMKKVIK